MNRIYVAGPITKGDHMLNMRKAIEAAHQLREIGCFPFVPHLFAQWHFLYPREYEDWMKQDFEWIRACHALFRVEGESAGADREVAFAGEIDIPVFHTIEAVRAWVQS
jgi:hypothetical protein